jgi:hypothetical protein
MPPHYQPDLRQALLRSLAEEGARLALCTPEPEVLGGMMKSIRCKSLAATLAGLIAEHEPMLRAECDGATVSVRDLGGSATMTFTVTE